MSNEKLEAVGCPYLPATFKIIDPLRASEGIDVIPSSKIPGDPDAA